MKRIFLVSVLVVAAATMASSQISFGVNDLLGVKRVADPQISPDGRMVAFTVGTVDKAANKIINQVFVMNIDGSGQRQVTTNPSSSSAPRWSPDGKRVAYVSGGQIWTMEPDGDNKEQVTRISTGASGPVWSRDGRWIAFGSEVYPECRSDDCNKAEDARVEGSKVQAKVAERLLFRHWNEWRDRKRAHVFVVASRGGAARDVTPGDFDSPPYAAGSGVDYTFSPDGANIAFLRNPDRVEATSTNSDIYIQPLNGGEARNITAAMGGYDVAPIYTPDGRFLLFRSQERAKFEADRWRIMRYELSTGQIVELTRGFDLQVDEMTLSPDGRIIYFTAGERGRAPIYSLPVDPDLKLRIATHVRKVADPGFASNISTDGRTIVFLASSVATPAEVMRVNVDGSGATALTTVNNAGISSFGLAKVEDLDWKGALNQNVHGFLLKPARFDPSKRYPLIVLIHGGPQGAWSNNWGYRWNPQIFANQGYVVFMPNPRGSTGYGQKFVDDISADWGGKAAIDIANGVAEVIQRPFVDKSRIGAAGASYGGYMVDWLLGHNNDPRFKYKAFVSHAGVYNLESMAATTEEIWFVNWEFKGMPWENPVNYNRWSPHKFARNFNTPTLVTGGELDFRVPVDQSLQLFTTLQLKNVDSKLIIFPDEGHWIMKPQNSEFWYTNVLDWFKKYLRP